MAIKQRPENETQFINEIRDGLNEALPGLVLFYRYTGAVGGAPDAYLQFLLQPRDENNRIKLGEKKKVIDEFWVEFKYQKGKIRSLQTVWSMLRNIQQVTLLRMAAEGKKVFVCVCENGEEAHWFRINIAQSKLILKGKAPAYTALALEYVSVRKDGKWTSGQDWGDLDTGPTPPTFIDVVRERYKQGKLKPTLYSPDQMSKVLGLTK